MDNEEADRLARIETKVDIMLPHFQDGGMMPKLAKMHAEFQMAKKLIAGLWAALVAYISWKR